MTYKVQGTIHDLGEVETIEGRNGTWRKRMLVLEEPEDDRGRSNCISFKAFGDAVDDTDGLREGEEVEIKFTISSREYNDRWYTDLNIVRVHRLAEPAPAPSAAPRAERIAAARAKVEAVLNGEVSGEGQDDDLPF